jgi:class 3 adenylate cyclase
MECPKCRHEIPKIKSSAESAEPSCSICVRTAEQKICRRTNSAVNAGIPSCRPQYLPQKRFPLKTKSPKSRSYLPQGLTEKILSQKNKIEGERKQVTVLFCDMAGFTPLTEILGPEEAYTIMDQVYEILIHKVHEFEGTVNEMTGDGVMALFGAPISLEDAPQRAIRTAMAIHKEITRFNEKLKQEKKTLPPIKMRIGIHTGPVVVGTLGNDLRVEFKAVGDTVNLASRVENLAEPGATCVTEDTFKITEGLFRFEALGEKKSKAKKIRSGFTG